MASITVPHKGLAEIVHGLKQQQSSSNASDDHPQTPPLASESGFVSQDKIHKREGTSQSHLKDPGKSSASGYRHPPPCDLKQQEPSSNAPDEHSQSPPLAQPSASEIGFVSQDRTHKREGTSQSQSHLKDPRKSSASGYRHPPPSTPSGRTGPPRSLSYSYSISGSRAPSRSNSHNQESVPDENGLPPMLRVPSPEEYPDHTFDFNPATSPFRGALEYANPEQREREREIAERKLKRRESTSYFPETWNPVKWMVESPREEHTDFTEEPEPIAGPSDENGSTEEPPHPHLRSILGTSSPHPSARRSRSLPYMKSDSKGSSAPKWGRLRSLLPHLAGQAKAAAERGPSTVAPPSVNITDELIAGGLSTLMLRLWFERDEKDHRRVPALFHRLKIRISDSLLPMHGQKAVFRIECEYANGAARWVVYRQLREFWSLHTHYAISNAYNRNVETLPDFPRTSFSFFKWLKEKGNDVGRAEFARMQREALENYLIGLIRAVMFHPAANRLAGFLEISALFIALAQSGGAQYKAGLLRIMPSGNKGTLGRRGTGWRESKKQKWCAVRESYLVILEEMGELTVHDVFLIDADFKIERPKRYYRQGLSLLSFPEGSHDHEHEDEHHENDKTVHDARSHISSTIGSIREHIAHVLHIGSHHHSRNSTDHPQSEKTGASANGNGNANAKASTSASAPGQRRRSSSSSSRTSTNPFPSEHHSRPVTPMLDPSTNTNPLLGQDDSQPTNLAGVDLNEEGGLHLTDEKGGEKGGKKKSADVSKHTFYVENSQMRLKLFAKNERQMMQWITALEKVARESHFFGTNRFDSFAPIRLNVAAQWLVDGRDYFWNLSRALLLAKETIYIHDWWLSPELQMRRPQMDKYRLDRLLEKKAKDGVKIYIILYQEVSNRTTPTDSNYAKQRLTALHPNILVQRSPSHFQTGTFYWAHHEKLCVIDQAIAFMGGLDLCFGRWDTPQHVLVDDPEVHDASDAIWPGKDYSNPRMGDFHNLQKPEEDMYDRGKVPRMPWHDVSMQVVGQPARDLARHFVQRWNYLLRIKNHSRPMPFLLPPPEFRAGELTAMGLTGTCELQICRSAGAWSLGTPERTECSIQNAYLKAIQLSEHFVYIENQFFITSTVVNDVKIENRIGDALVHRIIRAYREGTPWRCCIVIPLLPGFTFPVDHSDASAIRIILECQTRTIFRGPNSIFIRLRKEGIDPDEYISVFSLRNWSKLRGDVLTTEQVYIHGKVCIVDDRLAIIGSANINERSQRGDRDSEIAAVIRDTDMIDCTMAGKPFKVGRFAHTLRVRLMREHLGVDVDAMYEDDLMALEPTKPAYDQEPWDPDTEQEYGGEADVIHVGKSHRLTATKSMAHDAVDGIEQAVHGTGDVGANDSLKLLRKIGFKPKVMDSTTGDASQDEERKMYDKEGQKVPGFASSVVPTLEEKMIAEHPPPKEQSDGQDYEQHDGKANGQAHAHGDISPIQEESNAVGDGTQESSETRVDGEPHGAPANVDAQRDDQPLQSTKQDAGSEEKEAPSVRTTLRKHLAAKLGSKSSRRWILPTPTPHVDPHGFEDPISDEFWKNVWVACAVHNTEIYRKVFHAIPDDLVTTWKQYREFVMHHERLNKPVKEQVTPEPVARVPSESADAGAPGQTPPENGDASTIEDSISKSKDFVEGRTESNAASSGNGPPANGTAAGNASEIPGRRPSKGQEPFTQSEREEMERLLEEVRGHLVLYPTRFLEGEDVSNNFLFNADRLLPLPIYD